MICSCHCISSFIAGWNRKVDGISPWTLRYQDQAREQAFAAQHKIALGTYFARILAFGLIGSLILISFMSVVYMRLYMGTPIDTAHWIHLVRMGSEGVLILAMVLCIVVLRCSRFVQRSSPATLEAAVTSFMILLMTGTALADRPKSARILGYDHKEIFGNDVYASDSRALLVIDLVITCVHIGLPIRWFQLLPLEIAAVLLYVAIVAIIGNDEPAADTFFSFVLLTLLILLASLGKRASELGERIAFMSMIEEKSLRCDAEFKLACAEEGPDPSLLIEVGSESATRSKTESKTTSTGSGKVFDPLQNDPLHTNRTDIVACLTRVAELGKAEHWLINSRELKLLPDHRLGSGAYGVVVSGIFCGMSVAVKCPRRRLNSTTLHRLPELCNELRVLRHLRHPHVVATHGAVVSPGQHTIALVLEFVQGVTLDQFMADATEVQCSDRVSPFVRYQLMLGVCRALMYMHSRHPAIVHGDIKSNNIMVESHGEYVCPKILDFGLSRLLTRVTQPLGGTLAWMAPEVLLGSGQVKCSADIYSFGRLLAFLSTGIEPLSEFSESRLRELLAQGSPPLPTWPRQCIFEPHCKDLVHSCIRGEEVERPNVVEVHDRLLQLPEVLGLADDAGHFLAEVQLVAHAGRGMDFPSEEMQPSLDGSNSGVAPAHSSATLTAHSHSQPSVSQPPSWQRPELYAASAAEQRAEPQYVISDASHQESQEGSASESEPSFFPFGDARRVGI